MKTKKTLKTLKIKKKYCPILRKLRRKWKILPTTKTMKTTMPATKTQHRTVKHLKNGLRMTEISPPIGIFRTS
jgi:hypothetical protein